MMDVTVYEPKWADGLPSDGADRCWLGESADGRQWLLKWEPNSKHTEPHWKGAGFLRDPLWPHDTPIAPEFRLMRGENAGFIIRHMPLPSTRQEKSP